MTRTRCQIQKNVERQMSEKRRTCALTGLHPRDLPFRDNADEASFHRLQKSMRQLLLLTITLGYEKFLSGGDMGADLWFAEIVNEMKNEHPFLELHFILPFETQANTWPEHWREKYYALLAKANDVETLQYRYTPGCIQSRNRHLIDSASILVAVYDGKQRGSTAYTISYAIRRKVSVIYTMT